MRKFIALTAALLATQTAAQPQPAPPKLLVVISVDQLSGDLFDEYRPQFAGGLDRLASGTVFRNASSGEPRGAALGDRLKARWAGSREVAVSGSTNAVPEAKNADQRWSWTGKGFSTDVPGAMVSQVVPKVNAAIAAALAQPRPPLQPTPFCQTKARPGEAAGQLGRAAGDSAALAASPELDGDTLALAAELADEMQLGRRAGPDLLTIHLAAAGNVARAHGTGSEAMCLQLIDLDREIGDFLSLLDSRGIEYAVALDGAGTQRVPILFWRKGSPSVSSDAPVQTSDIAPTFASLVGLQLQPGSIGGNCLAGVFGAACPTR